MNCLCSRQISYETVSNAHVCQLSVSPQVQVTTEQKSCAEIIYIALQPSVRLF